MWFSAPVLRGRIEASITEMQEYRAADKATSIGEHVAFLKESWMIIASAPIIGHGTGSIAEEFRRITAGNTGVSAEATVNPHNQTFAVAIQLGVVGAIALWAMWIAHLALFRGRERRRMARLGRRGREHPFFDGSLPLVRLQQRLALCFRDRRAWRDDVARMRRRFEKATNCARITNGTDLIGSYVTGAFARRSSLAFRTLSARSITASGDTLCMQACP